MNLRVEKVWYGQDPYGRYQVSCVVRNTDTRVGVIERSYACHAEAIRRGLEWHYKRT